MKIIDVSKHNGVIDWSKVKNAGVDGVIIRAGYGKGNIDNKFYLNIEGAIRSGIEHIGVYWFSYAYTIHMAYMEAFFTHQIISSYRDVLDLGVFFDWEYDSMRYAKKQGVSLDKNMITCINIMYCRTIAELGYQAGYYLNEDYAKNYIDCSMLTKYRKWYARYSSKAKPINAYLFQYTSSGHINGIDGNVDLDKLICPLSIYEVAMEILDGKWGNGITRKNKLESAGYDYRLVQDTVNKLIKNR